MDGMTINHIVSRTTMAGLALAVPARSQHSGEPFVGDEPRVRLWCRRRWSRPVAVVRTNMKQLYNVSDISHGEKQFTV